MRAGVNDDGIAGSDYCAAWHHARMSAALPLPAIPGDGPLRVGFSGGLDSTVLLHALAHAPDARARGLGAIHVHHGLQAGADAWAMHCEAVCDALGLHCEVARVHVARKGIGLEAAARTARHAAFAEQLPPGGVIALAHHRDDQAETVLMRALRASGPDGLAGMRSVRAFAGGWLWRPLLALSRAKLQAYAQAHGLRWIEDPSNARDDADRNFLRNRVMPLLRERWPHADAALARVATLQAESSELLDTGDAQAFAQARTLDPAVLRLDALLTLPAARRARVLRRWCGDLDLPPLPAQAVRWCEDDLAAGLQDRQPCFDWAGHRLQRWRGLLHAGPVRRPLDSAFVASWDGRAPLRLPDGGTLVFEGAVDEAVHWQVRARAGGERIRLPGRAHTHSLKHVLQSLEVPPWVRAQLPLLIDIHDRVIAAGDLVFDAGFDAWLRDGHRRLRWLPPDAADAAVHMPMA